MSADLTAFDPDGAPAEPVVRTLPPQHVPEEVAATRRIHPLLWGLAGFVLGIVVGSLWWQTRADDASELSSGLVQLAESSYQSGLAASVADFAETLLVVVPNETESMGIIIWPPGGHVQRLSLPASWTAITLDDGPFTRFAAIDASGRQVAVAAPVARDGTFSLLAGRPSDVDPVATGVTSYVWHHSADHHLAYTVVDGGQASLEAMRGAPRQVELLAMVDRDNRIVAWADWGYALANGDRLTLVTANGERVIDGVLLATTDDRVLVENDGVVELVNPIDGSSEPSSIAPGVSLAVYDPSGNRLAVVRSGRLELIVDGRIVFDRDWPQVEQLAWSGDGRFVVFSDRVSVMVIDVTTGTVTSLGFPRGLALGTRAYDINVR